MTRYSNTVPLFFSIFVLMWIKCGLMPPNPADDPNNAKITLFLNDENYSVEAGKNKEIGMHVVLPEYFESYRLTSSSGNIDTVITISSISTHDTAYFNPRLQIEGICTLKVTASYLDQRYKEKADSLILVVLTGEPAFKIRDIPPFTTHTAVIDTLHFIISASGTEDITCTVASDPEVDSAHMHLITPVDDDTVMIHFDPKAAGIYTVTLDASAGELSTSASVTVTVLESIIPVSSGNPQTLITGTTDTLIFTLTPEQVAGGVTMELLDTGNLPEGIVTVLPGGTDSIIIVVTPAGEGTLSVAIASTNGTLTDTATYTFSFVDQGNAVWATASATSDAVEGRQCTVDLIPYLFEGFSIDDISLIATVGSIDGDGVWTCTPPWGSDATVPVTITGKRDETSQDFSLTLNVASGDDRAPEITLLSPATASKTVSSSRATVSVIVKDAGAGVDRVTFAAPADTIDGTADNDTTYTAVITGLAEGTATDVVVTAIDGSMNKNSGSTTISLTFDPTMEDGDAPVFTRVSGPQSGGRVTSATGTLDYSITDESGVDSVWWTLNDVYVAAVPVADENEYTISYDFSPDFGRNVIELFAKDASSGRNEGSRTITLDYNTKPSAITLTAPETDKNDVSTSPAFEWSGGEDADGEEVTFTVHYGTSATDLGGTASVSGKTATPGSALAYNTTYYWQVTATSASTAYPDEVHSPVDSFTTGGSLPTISAHPQSKSVEEGEEVTFSVTASANGFGTPEYQWRENGMPVGTDNDSFTIASVTTDKNGKTYDCVVSNDVGSTTSDAATLTVTAIPSFTVKFDMHGGGAIDSQTVVRGSSAKEPPEPDRNGYTFKGWFTSSTYAEGFDFGEPVTSNKTVHARWARVYSVTYHAADADDGTVPTDSNEYESGEWVTVANNTGNLSKDGNDYEFIGWTTSQDGSGTVYSNPQTIQVGSAGIDLYVKWEMNAPSFTKKIEDQSCPVNDAVTFNVSATGADLSYEWKLNGGTIENATGPSYTTSNLTKEEISTQRTYKCIVTNAAGSDTCSATLSVSTVTDASNNIYHEIKLVNKIWMMENLKTTKYRDGSSIQEVMQGEPWLLHTTGAYCWRENDISDKEYGAIYNWAAVETGKLAPAGWRIATEADWTALFEAYDPCEIRTEDPQYWRYDGCTSYPSSRFSGFNAMNLGMLATDGVNYIQSNSSIYWWITEGRFAVSQHSMSTFNQIYNDSPVPGAGIRCVKD